MDCAERGDFVAIKMHFGEITDDGHIKPEFIRPFIRALNRKKARPFLTDTNTIYHGPRNNAVGHLKIAADHGFTQTRLHIPVIISDGLAGDDHEEIEINRRHFKSVKIASGIAHCNTLIALSHFKGHILAGFGGTIKNLGMGCGSKLGKFEMHSGASPTVKPAKCVACGACIPKCPVSALSLVNEKITMDKDKCIGCGDCLIACRTGALSITWNEGSSAVQEKMAEYALGAIKDKKAFYFNFLNHITPHCDCMGIKEAPMLDDIGILASSDPVAVDQASLDMVIKTAGDVFKKAHPQIDGTVQLKYAEEIGLGSRKYEVIAI